MTGPTTEVGDPILKLTDRVRWANISEIDEVISICHLCSVNCIVTGSRGDEVVTHDWNVNPKFALLRLFHH